MNRVAVIGANGFVGRACCQKLLKVGFDLVAIRRGHSSKSISREKLIEVGDFSEVVSWKPFLEGCNVVIWVAGSSRSPLFKNSGEWFAKQNVRTLDLVARDSVDIGVKHLIVLSSFNVYSRALQVIDGRDSPHPQSEYGRSKLNAEKVLEERLTGHSTDFTVIRPPLIYGEASQGSFKKIQTLVRYRIPIPVSEPPALISAVGLQNLVSFMVDIINKESFFSKIILVADKENYLITDFLDMVAKTVDRNKALKFVVPDFVFFTARKFLGAKNFSLKTCSNYAMGPQEDFVVERLSYTDFYGEFNHV